MTIIIGKCKKKFLTALNTGLRVCLLQYSNVENYVMESYRYIAK